MTRVDALALDVIITGTEFKENPFTSSTLQPAISVAEGQNIEVKVLFTFS